MLIILSGGWTALIIYSGIELFLFDPSASMEQGFAALSTEILLVVSIPIYILLIYLLRNYPRPWVARDLGAQGAEGDRDVD
jgi:hypothetical protein